MKNILRGHEKMIQFKDNKVVRTRKVTENSEVLNGCVCLVHTSKKKSGFVGGSNTWSANAPTSR